MSRPLAILVGFVGKLPYAGMSLFNLHYMVGLQQLGYDVHYVERLNKPNECYDPTTGSMGDDPAFALETIGRILPRHGITRWSLIDRDGRCHGAGWDALRDAIGRAALVLAAADATWFPELSACSQRMFVDGDPMFTQAALLEPGSPVADALRNYPVLFTYGARIGREDCAIPDAGRAWIPTRPPVATALWKVAPPRDDGPVTALLHWGAGSEVVHAGRAYGHKDCEFERFIDLPRRTAQPFALAVGGRRAPRERLSEKGWTLADPLEASGSIEAYERFIDGSRADFGVAKHAYVASRSGWFSDRATCFLARGRPVLHQDTGFGDCVPVDDGVLPFATIEEVLEGLERLDADYARHARAARRIAEEQFEARTVVGRMIEEAGFS